MPERNDIPGAPGDPPNGSPAPPERLRWEREREVTLEFFRLVNDSDSLQNLIDAATNFFQQHSQCEAVAVRLRRGRDLPCFHAVGRPEEFRLCENHLGAGDCFGEIVPDSTGAATLECRCGEVIRGQTRPAQPFFTAEGSFWINDARAERGDALPHRYRSAGYDQRYQSIALIALKAGKQRIGLLQFNDRQSGRFTLENILLWEGLASYLAVALARFSAEETLRESEQRLMQAVNIACLGIFEHDHRTGLSHHSPDFSAIYGLGTDTPATLEQIYSRILPEDREPLKAALRQSFDPNSDGLLQREHRILHPDGIRWLFVRAQTFFEGEGSARHPLRTVGAIIDITGRKQDELELTASRQQLRNTLDAAKLGVWSHNLDTGVITGDALAYSVFGLPDGQVFSAESVLESIVPEDHSRFLEQRAQLQQSDVTLNGEYRIRIADGSTRWIAMWGNQVRDQSGKPILLTGLVQDITARKQTEEKIKALEEQFRHSQKMEAVGRLAGGIAHDFNNLLMVIRSYAEIMEDSLPPQDGMRRNTEAILKATDRAASLTGQMLAFSRKQMLSPVKLNLNDSVAESAGMLQRLIGEDIELRVVPEPSLWIVRADPDQIAQVLMNLSLNSRDAMPVGGVLTLETRNITAGPSLIERYPFMSAGNYVVLSVIDTGTGIAREVQERMFEPFFTTKGIGKGTGLGLSTVYGIVKQSGGYLLCESQLGRGATFSLYLPRIHDEPSGEARRGTDWFGRETILIVEDEDALRESIRQFLSGLGYTVLAADSGQQALDIANHFSQPIHLMITDVVMPRMTGRELSQMLVSIRPAMKTIFMSGCIDDAVVRHGVKAEGVAFLQKPFSLGMLGRKLRDLLG